ncbi:MAG: hypothetical protein K6A95_03215 [Bacteroidales bacterium]|nr:hypothetical protein [Bacteroidales bacterium]
MPHTLSPDPCNLYSPPARYYHSTLSIWLSVDPLSDKYPGVSPYTYCADNPVRLVDPDGREFGEYFDMEGNWLGTDGKIDFRVYFVKDADSQAQLRRDAAEKKFTTSSIKSEISTSIFVLNEIIDVFDRTAGGDNNGNYEEASTFDNDFLPCIRSERGVVNHVEIPSSGGSTSIHSHTFVEKTVKGIKYLYAPEVPSRRDEEAFKKYALNVIVGKTNGVGSDRLPKAFFYNSSTKYIMDSEINTIRNISEKYGSPVKIGLRNATYNE